MARRRKAEPSPVTEPVADTSIGSVQSRRIPVELIDEPPQPIRCAMDDEKLRQLAESIRTYGLIHPIAVVPHGERFEIFAGHRRFIATKMLGLSEIDATVWRDADDAKFGMMLDENIMREDVTAAEEGRQFLALANERNWSIEQMVKHFDKTEHYINSRVGLVMDFPDITEVVDNRMITWQQATVIMRCKDKFRRSYLIDQAANAGASPRALTAMVEDYNRQDRQNMAVQQPAETGVSLHFTPPPSPRCLYCGRDDDQPNMRFVTIHSYHQRDLEVALGRAEEPSHDHDSTPQ